MLACLLALYVLVLAPERAAIRTLTSQMRGLYELANRNDEAIAREPRVQAARREFLADIDRIAGISGAVGPSLLDGLDEQSAALHVRIISITPGESTPGDGTVSNLTSERELGIEMEGHFVSILAMIRNLGDSDRLVGVDSVHLISSEAGSVDTPVLHAIVAAHTYTLLNNWKEERQGERSPTAR